MGVAAEVSFMRPLKVGMTGEDVRALQVLLNTSSDTRVSITGPGSPGNESTYFGQKTATAVSRFQEKYRTLILTPNGLSTGTGYVGPSTLAVLGTLKKTTAATSKVVMPLQDSGGAPAEKPKLMTNQDGLSRTLTVIENLGVAQGMSRADLDLVKARVTEEVRATTTSLMAAFVTQVQRDNPLQKPLTLSNQLRSLMRAFTLLFVPESVHALDLGSSGIDLSGIGLSAAMGLPFGGAIDGVPVLCLCSGTWWIPITPLPPTFPVALTYAPGSQAFLSYNIPATLWLLGRYAPTPVCLIPVGAGCAPIPAEGHITPIVGSSPL